MARLLDLSRLCARRSRVTLVGKGARYGFAEAVPAQS